MKTEYTQNELDSIMAKTKNRGIWDFSNVQTIKQPVPWVYIEIVKNYLNKTDTVLDIGTGWGGSLFDLSKYFKNAIGIDIDTNMININNENAKNIKNVEFKVLDANLDDLDGKFNIILDRHCGTDLKAVRNHLEPNGYFITQQVGERNMQNIKDVLEQKNEEPPISKSEIENAGLKCIAFAEYNVEIIVPDIDSLVFWLHALDSLHSDTDGMKALANVDVLNKILANNVDERGFINNEHRYLVIAQL